MTSILPEDAEDAEDAIFGFSQKINIFVINKIVENNLNLVAESGWTPPLSQNFANISTQNLFSGSPDLVREVPLAILREEVEGQEQGRQRQEEQEAVVEEPTNTKINILQNPNS